MQEAGKEISNLYRMLRDTNPSTSRHDCLLVAIEQGIESLPKKKTGKKGWYEGNEKELVEWIERRNAATLRHATTKNHDDLVHLRSVRATLKKLKRKSKNDWWMKLLRQCNATVNPSANDNKYPGNIWSMRKTIMTKGARWLPRSFQNVRDKTGEKATTPEGNAKNLSTYFADIFDPTVNPEGWKEIEAMTQRPELVGWGAPQEHETRAAILHLKETAAGPSGIPACVWKCLEQNDEMFKVIHATMTDCWEREKVPEKWGKSHVAVLPKPGDTSHAKNYRAIMMAELDCKIYQNILNSRLAMLCELIAPEHSNGFRPGRGTADSLFIFLQTLRKRKEHGKDSWVSLLDVVKAFDRVPRECLWATMRKCGVPDKMVAALRGLYKNMTAEMIVDGVVKGIATPQGTGQGSILGPRLFAFFMLAILDLAHARFTNNDATTGMSYKHDDKMTGRDHRTEGARTDSCMFGFADDTAPMFDTKTKMETNTSLLVQMFERLGLGGTR